MDRSRHRGSPGERIRNDADPYRVPKRACHRTRRLVRAGNGINILTERKNMKIITGCLLMALSLLLFTTHASAQTAAPFWELIGGYEGDTHGSSYAFFGPGYVHP